MKNVVINIPSVSEPLSLKTFSFIAYSLSKIDLLWNISLRCFKLL